MGLNLTGPKLASLPWLSLFVFLLPGILPAFVAKIRLLEATARRHLLPFSAALHTDLLSPAGYLPRAPHYASMGSFPRNPGGSGCLPPLELFAVGRGCHPFIISAKIVRLDQKKCELSLIGLKVQQDCFVGGGGESKLLTRD